jgi:translation initiation factor IF-1
MKDEKITDEFVRVGKVIGQIRELLSKNNMDMSINNGVIVVGKIQLKTTDASVWISLYPYT